MRFKRPQVRYADTPQPATPYQSAAQVWDERIGSARVQAKNWRFMAFGCLTLALLMAGGLVWRSAQSIVTPYVIEVDQSGQVRAVGDDVYWTSTIAAEDGRTTVRRLSDGVVEDLTPTANVRSRAMEYGGGAYAVDGSRLAWCDDLTRQVWVRDAAGEPRLSGHLALCSRRSALPFAL